MGHSSYLKVKCMCTICARMHNYLSQRLKSRFLKKNSNEVASLLIAPFLYFSLLQVCHALSKVWADTFHKRKEKKSWKKFLLGKRSMWTVRYYLCIIIEGLEMRLRVFSLFFIATLYRKFNIHDLIFEENFTYLENYCIHNLGSERVPN